MNVKGFSTLGFDKIYVLNLPRRTDRREMLVNELRLNGIIEYEFLKDMIDSRNYTFKKLLDKNLIDPIQIDPSGTTTVGVFGCALSHYNAWVTFARSDYENALILEDDVYLGDPSNGNAINLYEVIRKELPSIKDWDILFLSRLSGFTQNIGRRVTEHIISPISSWQLPYALKPWGAHSYVVNKKAVNYMVKDFLPIWTPVDIYLDSFTLTKELNVYSTINNYFYQRNQWLALKQDMVSKIALETSDFGKYNDSDIVSNKIEDGTGFATLRTSWKNMEAVATIHVGDKILTFLTEKSFNDFLKKSSSIKDIYPLFKGTRLSYEGGSGDAKMERVLKEKRRIKIIGGRFFKNNLKGNINDKRRIQKFK